MIPMPALPPQHLPVLTEVLDLPTQPLPRQALRWQPAPAAAGIEEARLVNQVLVDVQQRVDNMLEYRLREALAPLLARYADDLVAQARDELARTLRDVVARAVAQELGRTRNAGAPTGR